MRRTWSRRSIGGFTVIELMVAVAVAGLLLAVAVPNYSAFIANQRVKTVSQDLFMSLSLARSEAIKRNSPVSVRQLNGAWSNGWEVLVGGDRIRVNPPDAVAGVTLDGNSTAEVTFLRNGRAASAVVIKACDSQGKASQRMVEVTVSGRSQVSVGGSCS